jgi:sulfonate transport system substrate-binding protein
LKLIFPQVLATALLLANPAVAENASLETPKLRLAVGGKSAVFYLPLSVTERLGYFKDAGLDVEIADVQSGARALQSIIGGSAEVGIGTFDHAIQMQAKSQPVVAVIQYGRYPGFVLVMMTSKAALYKSPQSLKGLKIGVTSPDSSTHFMAAYMLVRNGKRPRMHHL